MDRSLKINNKQCGIDINEVILPNQNEKKKVARRRWGILAKALKSPSGSEPSSPTDGCSLRRISSFMLVTTTQLEAPPLQTFDPHNVEKVKNFTWFKYSMRLDDEYFVNVSHRNRTISAEDLMGFNNTGNVCIWPSEETLSYYILSNLSLFHDKTVIEIGGGMSCMAGLFCAKYGRAKQVTLTDGNKISVENAQITTYCNEFSCPTDCRVLKWDCRSVSRVFDVILCADCLFFDDARADLIETLWGLLREDGLALVMAPKRASTLSSFVLQSKLRGFVCKQTVNYNQFVWDKHLALLDKSEYDENIHYPILIELTKI